MPTPRLDDPIGPNGESRERMILAGIRAGGYPQVAAEAWGVPAELFRRWMRRGRFKDEVRQAAAQARLRAEIETRDKDARFWLRHGPGKERPDAPGWSAPPRAGAGRDGDGDNWLLTAAGQALLADLRRGLEGYPEAKAQVAEFIETTTRNP